MPCLPNDFAKQSIVSYTSTRGMTCSSFFLGALRPLIHGVEHGGQCELPPLTERARTLAHPFDFENVISNQVKELLVWL